MHSKLRTWAIGLTAAITVIVITGLLASLLRNWGDIQLIYRLHQSREELMLVERSAEANEYLAKRSDVSRERLIARLERQGWVYTDQLGSAYILRKGERELGVTTRLWRHFYVRIKVHDPAVKLIP